MISEADAIRADTLAVRLLADAPGARGGLVWQLAGALADTAAALLELPAPGEKGAPSLILAVTGLSVPLIPTGQDSLLRG